MAVDIGPRIGLEGEKEFRQSLNAVNQQLKTLGSEMKSVTSAFDDNDDAEQALSAQMGVLERSISATEQKSSLLTSELTRQQAKLSDLGAELDRVVAEYGDTSQEAAKAQNAFNRQYIEVGKLQTQLNNTTASLNRMQSELSDMDKELNAGPLEKLKNQIRDLAGDSALGRLMDGGGISGILGKGLAVGAVVGGVQQLASAMFDVVESTQEYRSVMASLEVSSQAAGYTAEETAATYQRLQSVLGDTQTAATATANLQAIGLSQEQLMTVTDAAIGAWARYGDSIPIDGLAESINETIQAGQVTGTFADVLNWAGTSEDDFNAKLEAASSTTERANIVLQELANQGLAETGAAWIENNKDLTETNAATEKLNAAWARLGETLAPLAAGIKSLGADALNFLLDQVDKGIAFFSDLPERALTWGKDLIDSFVEGIKSKIRAVTDAVKDVAGEVADFLGFSEPERGPLSDFHTFAPDMMDLYSRGIRDNAYKVTAAVDSLADRMQAGLPSPTVETVRRAAADTVNGISAINSGYQFPREIVLTLENGQQIARWLLPYSRAAARANPEVGTT